MFLLQKGIAKAEPFFPFIFISIRLSMYFVWPISKSHYYSDNCKSVFWQTFNEAFQSIQSYKPMHLYTQKHSPMYQMLLCNNLYRAPWKYDFTLLVILKNLKEVSRCVFNHAEVSMRHLSNMPHAHEIFKEIIIMYILVYGLMKLLWHLVIFRNNCDILRNQHVETKLTLFNFLRKHFALNQLLFLEFLLILTMNRKSQLRCYLAQGKWMCYVFSRYCLLV